LDDSDFDIPVAFTCRQPVSNSQAGGRGLFPTSPPPHISQSPFFTISSEGFHLDGETVTLEPAVNDENRSPPIKRRKIAKPGSEENVLETTSQNFDAEEEMELSLDVFQSNVPSTLYHPSRQKGTHSARVGDAQISIGKDELQPMPSFASWMDKGGQEIGAMRVNSTLFPSTAL